MSRAKQLLLIAANMEFLTTNARVLHTHEQRPWRAFLVRTRINHIAFTKATSACLKRGNWPAQGNLQREARN